MTDEWDEFNGELYKKVGNMKFGLPPLYRRKRNNRFGIFLNGQFICIAKDTIKELLDTPLEHNLTTGRIDLGRPKMEVKKRE